MNLINEETVRFKDAKIGDKVTRVLGWTIPVMTKVTGITLDKIIVTGDSEFSRHSGIELIPYKGIPVSQLL